MASECYYGMCPFHAKDEPVCHEPVCHASNIELSLYARIRELELKLWRIPTTLVDELQGRYRIVDTLNSPNMAEWEVVSRDTMTPTELHEFYMTLNEVLKK